jgi:hypothetical protein
MRTMRGGTWHCARVNEGQEASALRVPDAELEFGPDLVMHYRGQPFTGIAFDVMEDGTRSELSYVDGLQHGPARDWDASGPLRAEDFWTHKAPGHASIPRRTKRPLMPLIARWVSGRGLRPRSVVEATENAVFIDGPGELLPVHVGDVQVVLDRPQFRWQGPERRLAAACSKGHNQDGVLG